MFGLTDGEKTLFEMYSISNLFLKISKTGNSITFKLSNQHRAERNSQLIFSDLSRELVDQVLENLLASATLAAAHAVNSHNVPFYLWDQVLRGSLPGQPWH